MRRENELQRAVVGLLTLLENQGRLLWTHVPNGGRRGRVEAAILRGLGVRPGVPDLLLWWAGGHCQIELKAEGGYLTGSQRQWRERIQALGWTVHVCRSVEEVAAVLRQEGVIE